MKLSSRPPSGHCCDRRYVFFEFDRETQYNVSDDAGECSLEVVGDSGTSFTFVQH